MFMQLLMILQEPTHWVYANVVMFIVMVAGSQQETDFLSKYVAN
jgi:hypothetical protein